MYTKNAQLLSKAKTNSVLRVVFITLSMLAIIFLPKVRLRKHWDNMRKKKFFLSFIIGEPLCGLGRSTFWTDAPSGYSYYRVDSPCSSGLKFLFSDFFDDTSIRSHCTNYTRRKGRLVENL